MNSSHHISLYPHGLLAVLLLLSASCTADAAPPPNDNFEARATLAGATVDVNGDNTDATLQEGEVDPGGYGGASVWYQWTAPASGWVAIHTVFEDPANELDTVIAVFNGNSLATLQMLGHNDEAAESPILGPSQLVFEVAAGTAYQIAVHGFGDSQGSFELHIAPEEEPPLRITSLAFSPAAVDITASDQSVTVTVGLVAYEGSTLGPVDAYAGPSLPGHYGLIDAGLERISGDDRNAVYQGILTVPRYTSAGRWPVEFWLKQFMQNVFWTPRGNDYLEDRYLLSDGVNSHFDVINNGEVDRTPPTVSEISGFPATVDLSAGDVSFEVTLTLEDALAGLKNHASEDCGSVSRSGGGDFTTEIGSFGAANRISGTAQNGVYRATVTVRRETSNGTYFVGIELLDAAFNQGFLSDNPNPGEFPDGGRLPPEDSDLTFTVTGSGGAGDSGFPAWQQAAFTQAELSESTVSGPNGDPDGDDIPNLLEFALGLEPKTGEPAPWTPLAEKEGDAHFFSIRIRVPVPMPAGVRLTVEGIGDPGEEFWSSFGYAESAGNSAASATVPADGFQELTFRTPADGRTQWFMRLSTESSPFLP